jgi:hypothetical protein
MKAAVSSVPRPVRPATVKPAIRSTTQLLIRTAGRALASPRWPSIRLADLVPRVLLPAHGPILADPLRRSPPPWVAPSAWSTIRPGRSGTARGRSSP